MRHANLPSGLQITSLQKVQNNDLQITRLPLDYPPTKPKENLYLIPMSRPHGYNVDFHKKIPSVQARSRCCQIPYFPRSPYSRCHKSLFSIFMTNIYPVFPVTRINFSNNRTFSQTAIPHPITQGFSRDIHSTKPRKKNQSHPPTMILPRPSSESAPKMFREYPDSNPKPYPYSHESTRYLHR